MPNNEKSTVDQLTNVQLEINSRCNLRCATCLKTYYTSDWQENDMDFSLLKEIASQLPKKINLHIQGWGEPLLHPDIFKIIVHLKSKDFSVSFTTNGTTMDKTIARNLIKSGLDGLTFSMTGGCEETHDNIRGKETFNQLQENVSCFQQVKEELGANCLKTAISYMVTPNNIDELPSAIAWAKKVHIDTFVTVHLTQAGSKEQQKYHFSLADDYNRKHLMLRIRSHTQALFSPMGLKLHPFSPGLAPVCDKDPRHNLFISAAGDVSPCVFQRPPIDKEITWFYHEKTCLQKPLIFGNLREEELEDIWNKEKYRNFRNIFDNRCKFHDEQLAKVGYSMEGAQQLEDARNNIRNYFNSHQPPPSCSCCYKLEGF